MTTDALYTKTAAYIDAHCAGFCGWRCPVAKTEFDQQAIDRGYWDGMKKREEALARKGA